MDDITVDVIPSHSYAVGDNLATTPAMVPLSRPRYEPDVEECQHTAVHYPPKVGPPPKVAGKQIDYPLFVRLSLAARAATQSPTSQNPGQKPPLTTRYS
ncbi:hypothetical protein MLPF_0995 [Mycobacterium lepromatosis]|nr:hypothetical protein MLPF_0995 [Mycobacterium lepromatosis]